MDDGSGKGRLTAREWSELRLFGWFLLLINGCLVGLGFLFARSLDDGEVALWIVGFAAVVVDGAFLLIVGGNVALALARDRWRRR
jgi:hypothetical protein